MLKKALSAFPYLPRIFGLVWSSARGWTIAWLFLLIAQGFLPMSVILLTKNLINLLVEVMRGPVNSQAFTPVLELSMLMGLALILVAVLSSVTNWVKTNQSLLIQEHVQDIIHTQSLRLDLAFYESTEYYNQLHRAQIDALNQPIALLESVGALLQNGITLVSMAAVLFSYAWWLVPVLLISTLPVLWAVWFSVIKFHEWRVRNTINERRSRYYDWIISWQFAAAELRLFDLGGYFRDIFTRLFGKLRNDQLALARQQMLAEVTAALISLLVMAATMLWVIWRSVEGLFNLGELALFYQVFSQGQQVMSTLLRTLGAGYRSLLFLEDLFEFIDLQPTLSDPVNPVDVPAGPAEIRFENISFGYPDSRKNALAGFNLTLPAGKITAIVGENGAGKSTLLKLLCRFYDPLEGQVTLGGINLRSFSQAALRRQISVLFQEHMHYDDTAANNIAFGDIASQPGRAEIERAAHSAGAHGPIQNLPNGYETLLGKWFGGAELSVGEWQRVALARAFLRQASIILLDEPTSAMDSWTEVDWMNRFRSLTAGRTTLIITHRFTTAMQADVIHVMDHGKIIESGTHAELLEQRGKYAQSWRAQMREAGL